MKTTKNGNGTYKAKYKGQSVSIVRVFDHNNKVQWYCQINDNEVHDWVFTKKRAIEDAVYMIDNASEYGIELI